METVGILTLTGENNFGNKLQNYAVQELVESLGYQAETIRVSPSNYQRLYFFNAIKSWVPLCNNKANTMRRRKFFLFNKKFLKQNPKNIYYGSKNIQEVLKKYKYILFGSDQIWNTEFKSFSDIYLGYYSENSKNIAIAASFGKDTIDDDFITLFEGGVKNFKAISVREDRGVDLVEKVGGTAELLMDPTIALTPVNWQKIEKAIEVPKKYLVTYFLGKSDLNKIEKIANEKNLDVFEINSKSILGPDEFLYVIRNSEIVCTDSFHATMFAILFGKSFYLFNREDKYSKMNSRTETLLSTLGIQCVDIGEVKYVDCDVFNNSHIQENIDKERARIIDFLRENLL